MAFFTSIHPIFVISRRCRCDGMTVLNHRLQNTDSGLRISTYLRCAFPCSWHDEPVSNIRTVQNYRLRIVYAGRSFPSQPDERWMLNVPRLQTTDCTYPLPLHERWREIFQDCRMQIPDSEPHIAHHTLWIQHLSAHLDDTGSYLFLSGGLAISRFARELGKWIPARACTKAESASRVWTRRESGRAGCVFAGVGGGV